MNSSSGLSIYLSIYLAIYIYVSIYVSIYLTPFSGFLAHYGDYAAYRCATAGQQVPTPPYSSHERTICEGDTSTHAQGTDPRVDQSYHV